MNRNNAVSLPSSVSRRFVRYGLGFGVSIGIGMAPLLGKVAIPGFDALLGLFPVQLQKTLIPLSAFLMGLAALVTQFYHKEKIPEETINRYFRTGIIAILFSLFLLVVFYTFFVAHVSGEKLFLGSAVVTPTRLAKCGCEQGSSDEECLASLTLNPAMASTCWGGNVLKLRELALTIPYLVIMSLFGALIGLLLLREKESQPERSAVDERPQHPSKRSASRKRKASHPRTAKSRSV